MVNLLNNQDIKQTLEEFKIKAAIHSTFKEFKWAEDDRYKGVKLKIDPAKWLFYASQAGIHFIDSAAENSMENQFKKFKTGDDGQDSI